MRRTPTGIGAVIAALPWCCILPAALALLGSAGMGAAAAGVAGGWGRYALFGLSVGLLGRAHYHATWRRHGARWSRWTVWFSTVVVVVLWWIRL